MVECYCFLKNNCCYTQGTTAICIFQYIVDWKPSIRETVHRFGRRSELAPLLLCVSLWRGAHFQLRRCSRCGAVLTFFLDFRESRATARLFFMLFFESREASHASSTFSVLLPEASRESSTFIAHLLAWIRQKLRTPARLLECLRRKLCTGARFFRWSCRSFARRRLLGGSEADSGCRARKNDFLEARLI